MSATVTKFGILDMQVCVPSDWNDDRVREFAENEYPSGTNGWTIRRAGDPFLRGDPERCPCEKLAGHVHVMLDA